MACGLALLASGQAFAGDYYSSADANTLNDVGNIVDADLSSPTNWFDDGCYDGGGSHVPTSISLTGVASDRITICAKNSLNLSTAVTLEATTLFFDGGTWGGTGIKFGAGNKIIHNDNGEILTITLLDLSVMKIGESITIRMEPVKFSAVTPTNKGLSCGGAGAYIPGNAIPINTGCQVIAVTPPPAVSAPIFSTKEKPAVFSEEVK